MPNPDFVLSLARGLSVIEAFQDRPDGVSVGDVAARTGLSRAAVRRLLITLEMQGYATHNGPVYRLGSRVLRLGFAFLSSHSLPALAQPVLEEISSVIRESSSLSILEGYDIVYLARSATRRVMSVGISVGTRLPAYCTSMGRVLVAALPDEDVEVFLANVLVENHTRNTITDAPGLRAAILKVREQGYALVDQELEVGLRSLAVPVVNRNGKVVAAINTGVHASRVGVDEMISRFLPVLKDGALSMGQALT